MAPTAKEIYNGRAGFWWNLFCCPCMSTIGLLWKSISIYLIPCCTVLCQRCFVGCCWKYIFCWCGSWPYVDKNFQGATALGNHNGESGKQMNKKTDWIRAQDLETFRDRSPQLFEGEIEPNDLCQGAVGDCWLVAAFACASEFPDMIRHMFLTKEYNPRGLYKIRIYHPLQKKWVIVIIDDLIPCFKGTKQPRFMKPNGNELWAILLEKAYAKLCGSYADIEGGFVLWGWLSMTGDNVFQLSLTSGTSSKKSKKKSNNNKNSTSTSYWIREDMVPIPNKKNPKDIRGCGFRKTKEKYDDDQIWTLLRKYDDQKALMSASISKTEGGVNDGPAGEQMMERVGLVAGHAYSVIHANEVTERTLAGIPKGKTFKLLHIRNPWGTYEWTGDWSDHSKKWKKHSSIARQLGFDAATDDGSFWMEFHDFIRIFTRINICDRDTSKDASLDVNEDAGWCGIIGGVCYGCCQFWCCCHGFRNLYCSHESTDQTLDTKKNKFCFIC